MADPSLGPVVVLPDPTQVLLDYLRGQPLLTDIVADRISQALPNAPTWPAVRLTVIHAFGLFPKRLDRVMVQVDCWGNDEQEANAVARTVRGLIDGCGNYTHPEAVLGGASGSSAFPLPDESFTPPAHRWAVTGNVFMHPNP